MILKNNPIKNTGTTNSGIDGSSNSNGKQFNNEIVLLSQRYTSEQFGDKIVGEVLNNGGATARFVKITASFYDSNGIFLGSEYSFADPYTLEPGNKAPFELSITSETIKGSAKNYEFTLQWRDINGDDKSVRVKGDLTQNSKLGNIVSNNNIDGNNKVNINNPSGINLVTYKLHQTTVIPNMSFHATVTLSADFFQKDATPKNFKILTINGVNTLVYFINANEYIIVPLNQLTTANVDRTNPSIVNFIKITTKTSVSSHTSSNGGSDGTKNETKPLHTSEPAPTQNPPPNPSPQPTQT